jgi:hypothetical protein
MGETLQNKMRNLLMFVISKICKPKHICNFWYDRHLVSVSTWPSSDGFLTSWAPMTTSKDLKPSAQWAAVRMYSSAANGYGKTSVFSTLVRPRGCLLASWGDLCPKWSKFTFMYLCTPLKVSLHTVTTQPFERLEGRTHWRSSLLVPFSSPRGFLHP